MAELIPFTLQALLQRELAPGERVVWEARPAPASRALLGTGACLAGIPFFAVGVLWTWTAAGWSDYIWGGMLLVIGVGLLLSPVWEWWAARRTLYAVTDRRAVVIEALPSRVTVWSFAPEQLASRSHRRDLTGRGTLVFGRELVSTGKGGVWREIGFFGLEEARYVERLLPTPARDA